VGVARKDGENGNRAVLEYLRTAPKLVDPAGMMDEFEARLDRMNKPVIKKDDVRKLAGILVEKAQELSLLAYRFPTNEEMLAAIDRLEPQLGKNQSQR
jgi:hypothetical protein